MSDTFNPGDTIYLRNFLDEWVPLTVVGCEDTTVVIEADDPDESRISYWSFESPDLRFG